MRIAVCGADEKETCQMCLRMKAYAADRHRNAELVPFTSAEELWNKFEPGRFHGTVVGLGDAKGFLCARRLREEDRNCRVILIDDTDQYAIRGMRIHLTDFLVRPVDADRFQIAMERLFA